MTTDNKTLAVDVLGVMALDANHAYHWRREGSDTSWAEENSIQSEVARSAVAELIQIAMEFSDYVAVDHNDTSLLDREDMWDRLGSAVSRVKGESA